VRVRPEFNRIRIGYCGEALVNTVKELRVPKKQVKFLIIWVTISFSRTLANRIRLNISLWNPIT